MLQEKYLQFLKKTVRKFFPGVETKIFIFGSTLEKEQFRDIDIGLDGKIEAKQLAKLKEFLTESKFPFLVDLIDLNKVDDQFKNFISNQKVIWL